MESQSVNDLKKHWVIEGLKPSLRRKMKIVPPQLYVDAYNRAMDLESVGNTVKKKNVSSDDDDS